MRCLLIFLLWPLANQLTSQDTLLQIEGVVRFQLDPLGQLVYEDQEGRLLRRDLAGDTTYVFDNNLLGDISTIDVSNPFGPLLYFEDFNLVLLLDRTLNEVGRLDYRSSKVISSSNAVARNYDNKIWLFDAGDFRLKLLDQNGEVNKESDDLRRLLGVYSEPSSLFINANTLYAYFQGEGVAVFTNFGRFLHWERRGLGVNEINLIPSQGVGWQERGSYHLLTNRGSIRSIPLPAWVELPENTASVRPWQELWLVLTHNKLFYLK